MSDTPPKPAAASSPMRAVIYERYGAPDVLQFRDVPRPVPGEHDVLIQTHATTVSSGDWRMRSLEVPAGFGLILRLMAGVRRPRQPILGTELAGTVAAVGPGVRRFRVGDAVVAFSDMAMGCHAEYCCLPEDGAIAAKPPNLSFEQAAALSFGGTTALHFLRRAALQRGERLLVNGASGAVGTAVIQLAVHGGAEVTAVCGPTNQELVRSLGAVRVIDHTTTDFSRLGESFDVILDAVGNAPLSRCRPCLAPGGRLLLVVSSLPALLLAPVQSRLSGRRLVAGPASGSAEDLAALASLAENGVFQPVIDRVYPFEQIVAAHRHVDAGHKRGNVVISMGATPPQPA
ncbi:NAD(P)-dependent alcohol dehydrogenase [Cyanobium sp. PCC 7001]|uniref:NAD(P)-dependent alcohol dehydrogenase n=1 Tax=Cyanobium sp. PCC 7001 TaxID=180281 RepID=UPI001CEC18BB|nr:NAD(P)-dependent alcohol dehydrogenase [Cyanobium sp. PCC 7001]